MDLNHTCALGVVEPGHSANRGTAIMGWTEMRTKEALKSRAEQDRYDFISWMTGFADGDEFESDDEVRRYFTVDNIIEIWSHCIQTQGELDRMADDVIRHRWHMVKGDEE
jgi:hypothetical protein